MLPDGIRIAHPDKLYIGGEWVAPIAGAPLEITSPDTEEVVAITAQGGNADMDAAVAAARHAFDHGPWPLMSPAERIAKLRAIAAYLGPRAGELAAAWSAQVGGLASFAVPMHMGGIATLEQIAGFAENFTFAQQRASTGAAVGIIAYEPVGVVAAIAPWNAPFGIMANKLAYALCAGCTVIMKPSPETPLEAYILAEAAEAVGLPKGVVNMVPAEREASDHLICNPGVDKVSFTGSTQAGKRIASVCGERIARCTLELGGKSAAIVRDDFPIELAAAMMTGTICVMSGQVCAMLSRVIVSKHRHDALADAIAAEMAKVKIGHSWEEGVQLGPLAMKRQLERVESYIAAGRATADLVCGGARPAQMDRGYFIEPTLFANVKNESRIARDEIFGPVLSLIAAEDEEDAVRIANDSHYGLNGAVLTHDADAAYRIARAVRSGAVGQNGMRLDFGLPFGGFKQSGIGREGGLEGLMGYLESKTILLDGMPSAL